MNQLVIQERSVPPDILEKRNNLLDEIESTCKSQIQWYETESVNEYRQMRRNGTNGFPKPKLHEGAKSLTIMARDKKPIDLRILHPTKSKTKGVLLHFHAGGFVIGSSMSYDMYLLRLANELELVAVSVEYRLAPENPYPGSQLDCLDAALFALSANGEAQLGGPLVAMAGESAGGYLVVWTALALRDQHKINVRSRIKVLLPSCGMYDLSYLPSMFSYTRPTILSGPDMARFVDTALPNILAADRKAPEISPLYANLSNMPPALFLCGTSDPLMDDSSFMAIKWSQADNISELRLIKQAAHAPMLFPWGEVTEEAIEELIAFVRKHLS